MFFVFAVSLTVFQSIMPKGVEQEAVDKKLAHISCVFQSIMPKGVEQKCLINSGKNRVCFNLLCRKALSRGSCRDLRRVLGVFQSIMPKGVEHKIKTVSVEISRKYYAERRWAQETQEQSQTKENFMPKGVEQSGRPHSRRISLVLCRKALSRNRLTDRVGHYAGVWSRVTPKGVEQPKEEVLAYLRCFDLLCRKALSRELPKRRWISVST